MKLFPINQGLITERAKIMQDTKLLNNLARKVRMARLNNSDGYLVKEGGVYISDRYVVDYSNSPSSVILKKEGKTIKTIIIKALDKKNREYRTAVKRMGNSLRFCQFPLILKDWGIKYHKPREFYNVDLSWLYLLHHPGVNSALRSSPKALPSKSKLFRLG